MQRGGHIGCWTLVASVVGYLVGLGSLLFACVVLLGLPFAILPDQDIKFGNHRGATHSLVFASIISVVAGTVVWLTWGLLLGSVVGLAVTHTKLGSSFLASLFAGGSVFAAFLSHLLTDVITLSGIPLFWPKNKRYALRLCRSDSIPANGLFIMSGAVLFLLVFWSGVH